MNEKATVMVKNHKTGQSWTLDEYNALRRPVGDPERTKVEANLYWRQQAQAIIDSVGVVNEDGSVTPISEVR